MTHAGQNSTIESLCAGVPLYVLSYQDSIIRDHLHNLYPLIRICWPFEGDQPVNSALLSTTHDAAFELFEVRSGEHGLKTIHRRGPDASPLSGTDDAAQREIRDVLTRARGPDGARKRANAMRLSEAINRGWDDGGDCQVELETFAQSLIGDVHIAS